MKISFAKSIAALLKGCRALMVVGPERAFKPKRLPKLLPRRQTELLLELARDIEVGDRGACGSTLTPAGDSPRKLIVGLLPDRVSRYNSPARAESIRRVVDSAQLGSSGKVGIVLLLDRDEHQLAAVNAVGRALPCFSAKSGKPSKLRVQLLALRLDGKALGASSWVRETIAASRDAAELVDLPPDRLDPEAFVGRAKEMLRDLDRVKIRVIVGDKLLEPGLRGIHTVGRSAPCPPRMLVADYLPSRPSGPHVALVGKGVTYDTGGLNLKRDGFMGGMKCDMGGAAAVLGAFRVLAAGGHPGRLSLLLCLAENGIGPAAYRPDDVIVAHSGKTVEINNTDAEGRLLLADGVSYAARELEAAVILDAATLTGAQLLSTGLLHAAVISNDEALERLVVETGRDTGDLAHPLPFAPELFKHEFSSEIADMKNSVKNRMNAQTSCAAQFVYWHIDDTDATWCHVDLAGPAFPDKRGTGYGVALLSETVRRMSA